MSVSMRLRWFSVLIRFIWTFLLINPCTSNIGYWQTYVEWNIDGLAQDRSISIVNALELLQSCTEPSIWPQMSCQIMKRGIFQHIFMFQIFTYLTAISRPGTSVPVIVWVHDVTVITASRTAAIEGITSCVSLAVTGVVTGRAKFAGIWHWKCNEINVEDNRQVVIHEYQVQPISPYFVDKKIKPIPLTFLNSNSVRWLNKRSSACWILYLSRFGNKARFR